MGGKRQGGVREGMKVTMVRTREDGGGHSKDKSRLLKSHKRTEMMGCWRFACFKPTCGAAAVSEKFITAILSEASTHCQRFF